VWVWQRNHVRSIYLNKSNLKVFYLTSTAARLCQTLKWNVIPECWNEFDWSTIWGPLIWTGPLSICSDIRKCWTQVDRGIIWGIFVLIYDTYQSNLNSFCLNFKLSEIIWHWTRTLFPKCQSEFQNRTWRGSLKGVTWCMRCMQNQLKYTWSVFELFGEQSLLHFQLLSLFPLLLWTNQNNKTFGNKWQPEEGTKWDMPLL